MPAGEQETSEIRRQLLTLLERHFGIGADAGRYPGWLLSRLDRAAENLLTERSGPEVLGYLQAHPEELAGLAELVRVGETRFFRDPEQWQALAGALPSLLPRSGRLRALSAGCSSGEEAWTLAMLLAESHAGGFRVVGVDRSSLAIEHARAARYAVECRRHVPEPFRARWTAIEGESLLVQRELASSVSFVVRDLLQGAPPGNYELIVCKNLLIYLKPEVQGRVLGALFSALAPGGLLLVARAELGRAKALGLPLTALAPGVNVVRAP